MNMISASFYILLYHFLFPEINPVQPMTRYTVGFCLFILTENGVKLNEHDIGIQFIFFPLIQHEGKCLRQ